MTHYEVLANSSEEEVCQLAAKVLERYAASKVKLLGGPRQGLVMLRVRETVASSQFNAGEILVTEVRLELDGQFGFGIVMGDSQRRAMAVALVDAALRKGTDLADELQSGLDELAQQLQQERERLYALVATTQVAFDTM